MVRVLTSLFAPVGEEVFLDHLQKKSRLHIRAGEPDRASALLPWATVNQLIAGDILPEDRIRIVRESVDLPPLMYRRQNGSLHTGKLQALLAQGVSIVINYLDELVPQVGRLADSLERRLGHRVDINAYLSFGKGGALKAHADDHDVLIIQVHGRKHWRSYGSPFPLPVERPKSPNFAREAAVWEATLEPGDLLYLPRGEVHETALEGPHSVHLTIGITTRRGVDYIGWLSKKAANDLAFRADITRLGGEVALRQQDTDLRARLHALIDGASLDEYLDAQDAERAPRPVLNMGHIGLDAGPHEHTVIAPTLKRRISLEGRDEVVEIGREQYRLSQYAKHVLGLLVARSAFEFGELQRALADSLSPDTVRDAVLELTRNGLVSFEEPAGG